MIDKLKLFGDRVFIEPDKAEETTESGIIIPKNAQNPKKFGTVTLVGSEMSQDIKPGDRILFGEFAVLEIDVDGETFHMVNTEDILGLLEE